MIVPTLTMLGRSWCPCSREAGIASLLSPRASLCPEPRPDGHPDPLGVVDVIFSDSVIPPVLPTSSPGPEDALPRFTLGRVFTEWDAATRC